MENLLSGIVSDTWNGRCNQGWMGNPSFFDQHSDGSKKILVDKWLNEVL